MNKQTRWENIYVLSIIHLKKEGRKRLLCSSFWAINKPIDQCWGCHGHNEQPIEHIADSKKNKIRKAIAVVCWSTSKDREIGTVSGSALVSCKYFSYRLDAVWSMKRYGTVRYISQQSPTFDTLRRIMQILSSNYLTLRNLNARIDWKK